MTQARLKYFDNDRHATWLELFFDLVFVASIGVITHHLAHAHHGHIEIRQVLLFPVEFIPVWWIWASHTLYANRFDTDSKTHWAASLVIFASAAVATWLDMALMDGVSGLTIRFFLCYCGIIVVCQVFAAIDAVRSMLRPLPEKKHQGARASLS